MPYDEASVPVEEFSWLDPTFLGTLVIDGYDADDDAHIERYLGWIKVNSATGEIEFLPVDLDLCPTDPHK